MSIIIENPSIPADSGKIEVQEDVNVGILVQKYNSTKKDVGYRVQNLHISQHYLLDEEHAQHLQ